MPSTASPDNIDLSHVWRATRRSLVWLLPLAALAGGLAYVSVKAMAPRYQAEAQLVVNARGLPNPFADPARDVASGDVAVRMDKEAVNTHVAALMAIGFGEQIGRDLKLAERPEFNSAAGDVDAWSAFWRRWGFGGAKRGESDMDRVLAAYQRQLEVYSPKESRTIYVRFTSVDPALAADVVNRLVEAYRNGRIATAVDETGQVLRSLEPEIEKLAREVGAAERAAQEFRGKANIFNAGQQATGLNEQQLTELSAELSRTKGARSEAEARMSSAQELLKADAVDAHPDVQKSPLIQSLIQSRVRVERQIAELSATLLPGHPRMRQLNSDLSGLKRQIRAETSKIVAGLSKEVTVARLREAALSKSIDDVKKQIVKQSPDEVTLRQLEAAAKSKRAELERLQAQFEANRARATSLAIPVETHVVTAARASSSVVYPKKLPITLAVSLATLLAGLGVVLTRAIVTGARLTPAEAKSATMPAATQGAVDTTQVKAADAASDIVAFTRPVTAVASVPDLAQRIVRLLNGRGGLRLVVGGGTRQVDTARDALALATALARLRRSVLLVDWRVAGARGCAASAGITAREGATDILRGTVAFDQTVHAIPGSAAHFLSGGSKVGEEASLDRNHLSLLFDALDETYDFIVVTGGFDELRATFDAVDGRFDAAITVGGSALAGDGRFLDFEVCDMDLYRLEPAAHRRVPAGRLRRRVVEEAASA